MELQCEALETTNLEYLFRIIGRQRPV
jgi:hypothetical protein